MAQNAIDLLGDEGPFPPGPGALFQCLGQF